jgi:hypothetical protein
MRSGEGASRRGTREAGASGVGAVLGVGGAKAGAAAALGRRMRCASGSPIRFHR